MNPLMVYLSISSIHPSIQPFINQFSDSCIHHFVPKDRDGFIIGLGQADVGTLIGSQEFMFSSSGSVLVPSGTSTVNLPSLSWVKDGEGNSCSFSCIIKV